MAIRRTPKSDEVTVSGRGALGSLSVTIALILGSSALGACIAKAPDSEEESDSSSEEDSDDDDGGKSDDGGSEEDGEDDGSEEDDNSEEDEDEDEDEDEGKKKKKEGVGDPDDPGKGVTERDCDTVKWGDSEVKLGEVVQRGDAQGFVDSDGDFELDKKEVDAGMCELHMSKYRCAMVVYGAG